MSMSGWVPPVTGEDWMRQQQRQVADLRRRNRLPRASQILGPGIAPWAVLILDWSGPETLYNGFFFSEIGALNSPDDTKAWIGTTFATEDGRGHQEVTELGVGSTVKYVRGFTTSPTLVRIFTTWIT